MRMISKTSGSGRKSWRKGFSDRLYNYRIYKKKTRSRLNLIHPFDQERRAVASHVGSGMISSLEKAR